MSTRSSTQSYGSKLGSSLKGVVGGFFAILIAIGLLWFNESNSVEEIRKITEGEKNTVTISSDAFLAVNNGKLVHLNGAALTKDTLVDPAFNVIVNAIKLRRLVEMYQYKENKKTETKDNVGGSTTTTETFTYEEVWSRNLINSDGFDESGRKNPKGFDHEANEYQAENVTLGAFKLSPSLIAQISKAEAYSITEEIYSDSTAESIIVGGKIYFGSGNKNPAIGDERISFEVVYPHDISVVSKQNNNSFEPYISKNGRTIELVYDGLKSAEEMFASEAQKNKILTWVLRFVGFLLMFIGFSAILKPISTLGSVIPLLGNVLGAGTGIIAFLLAFIISFVVIAIAWIFFRPILGISLLVIAGAAFYFGKKYFSKEPLAEIKEIKTENGYQK
jgi:hypothetical protein